MVTPRNGERELFRPFEPLCPSDAVRIGTDVVHQMAKRTEFDEQYDSRRRDRVVITAERD